MAVDVASGDVERTCGALLRYAGQISSILREAPDPTVPAVGVWNIAETAAHLALSSPYFLQAVSGQAELEDVTDDATATAHVEAVAREPERDLGRLAQRIVEGESALVAHARRTRDDPPVTPFQGIRMPLSAVLGVELGELIVHGHDIARAARLPWPVRPADAALALAAVVQVLPLLLDAERAEHLRIRCQLHIRHGTAVVIVVADGALHLEPPSDRSVDCHLTVDPLTFLLLSFHRIGPTAPVLTGKVLPWGRRPWLASRLQSALTSV